MGTTLEHASLKGSILMPTSPPGGKQHHSQGKAVRVLIADDHSIVAGGLRLALEHYGFEIVGVARTGQAALDLCLEREPDVLLLDIHMPDNDGLWVLEQLQRAGVATTTIIVTASLQQEDRRRAVELGADGYVSKEILPDQLTDIILSTLREGSAPRDGSGVSAGASAETDDQLDHLTNQEVQVLKLLARGSDNEEIGNELYISINTVKTHIAGILSKLEVENRTQAAVWAVRHGFNSDRAST